MSEYFITFECDCGETIKNRGLWLSGDVPEISWDNASCSTFECEKCEKKYYTGDFDYFEEGEV